jgi:hypothetical protein
MLLSTELCGLSKHITAEQMVDKSRFSYPKLTKIFMFNEWRFEYEKNIVAHHLFLKSACMLIQTSLEVVPVMGDIE